MARNNEEVLAQLKEMQDVLAPDSDPIDDVGEEEASEEEEVSDGEEEEKEEEVLDDEEFDGPEDDAGASDEQGEEDGEEADAEEGEAEVPEGYVSQDDYDKLIDTLNTNAAQGIANFQAPQPRVPTTALEDQQAQVGADPQVRQPIPNVGGIRLTDEQYEAVLSDKDQFSRLLNQVSEHSRQQALFDVQQQQRVATEARSVLDNFFKKDENRDLVRMHNVVTLKAMEIEAQEGGTPEECLAKAAEKVREDVAISAAVRNKDEDGKIRLRRKKGTKTPRFAQKGGSKGKPREVVNKKKPTEESKFEQELEKILSVGRR
jgi:hypothetical protein